ncbi:MAG: peptidase [Desulfobacula sp.]|nr:peptidase [Desulfobacula sp.]
MIKSFIHKGLENFFYKGTKKGINPNHADKLSDILDMLDAATKIQDMSFPGSNLHMLEPKRHEIYAVSISGAWRVTFKMEDGNVYIIDYLNYH